MLGTGEDLSKLKHKKGRNLKMSSVGVFSNHLVELISASKNNLDTLLRKQDEFIYEAFFKFSHNQKEKKLRIRYILSLFRFVELFSILDPKGTAAVNTLPNYLDRFWGRSLVQYNSLAKNRGADIFKLVINDTFNCIAFASPALSRGLGTLYTPLEIVKKLMFLPQNKFPNIKIMSAYATLLLLSEISITRVQQDNLSIIDGFLVLNMLIPDCPEVIGPSLCLLSRYIISPEFTESASSNSYTCTLVDIIVAIASLCQDNRDLALNVLRLPLLYVCKVLKKSRVYEISELNNIRNIVDNFKPEKTYPNTFQPKVTVPPSVLSLLIECYSEWKEFFEMRKEVFSPISRIFFQEISIILGLDIACFCEGDFTLKALQSLHKNIFSCARLSGFASAGVENLIIEAISYLMENKVQDFDSLELIILDIIPTFFKTFRNKEQYMVSKLDDLVWSPTHIEKWNYLNADLCHIAIRSSALISAISNTGISRNLINLMENLLKKWNGSINSRSCLSLGECDKNIYIEILNAVDTTKGNPLGLGVDLFNQVIKVYLLNFQPDEEILKKSLDALALLTRPSTVYHLWDTVLLKLKDRYFMDFELSTMKKFQPFFDIIATSRSQKEYTKCDRINSMRSRDAILSNIFYYLLGCGSRVDIELLYSFFVFFSMSESFIIPEKFRMLIFNETDVEFIEYAKQFMKRILLLECKCKSGNCDRAIYINKENIVSEMSRNLGRLNKSKSAKFQYFNVEFFGVSMTLDFRELENERTFGFYIRRVKRYDCMRDPTDRNSLEFLSACIDHWTRYLLSCGNMVKSFSCLYDRFTNEIETIASNTPKKIRDLSLSNVYLCFSAFFSVFLENAPALAQNFIQNKMNIFIESYLLPAFCGYTSKNFNTNPELGLVTISLGHLIPLLKGVERTIIVYAQHLIAISETVQKNNPAEGEAPHETSITISSSGNIRRHNSTSICISLGRTLKFFVRCHSDQKEIINHIYTTLLSFLNYGDAELRSAAIEGFSMVFPQDKQDDQLLNLMKKPIEIILNPVKIFLESRESRLETIRPDVKKAGAAPFQVGIRLSPVSIDAIPTLNSNNVLFGHYEKHIIIRGISFLITLKRLGWESRIVDDLMNNIDKIIEDGIRDEFTYCIISDPNVCYSLRQYWWEKRDPLESKIFANINRWSCSPVKSIYSIMGMLGLLSYNTSAIILGQEYLDGLENLVKYVAESIDSSCFSDKRFTKGDETKFKLLCRLIDIHENSKNSRKFPEVFTTCNDQKRFYPCVNAIKRELPRLLNSYLDNGELCINKLYILAGCIPCADINLGTCTIDSIVNVCLKFASSTHQGVKSEPESASIAMRLAMDLSLDCKFRKFESLSRIRLVIRQFVYMCEDSTFRNSKFKSESKKSESIIEMTNEEFLSNRIISSGLFTCLIDFIKSEIHARTKKYKGSDKKCFSGEPIKFNSNYTECACQVVCAAASHISHSINSEEIRIVFGSLNEVIGDLNIMMNDNPCLKETEGLYESYIALRDSITSSLSEVCENYHSNIRKISKYNPKAVNRENLLLAGSMINYMIQEISPRSKRLHKFGDESNYDTYAFFCSYKAMCAAEDRIKRLTCSVDQTLRSNASYVLGILEGKFRSLILKSPNFLEPILNMASLLGSEANDLIVWLIRLISNILIDDPDSSMFIWNTLLPLLASIVLSKNENRLIIEHEKQARSEMIVNLSELLTVRFDAYLEEALLSISRKEANGACRKIVDEIRILLLRIYSYRPNYPYTKVLEMTEALQFLKTDKL